MKKKEKEELVQYLRKRFEESEVLIISDYRGLNVEDISSLRQTLQENDVEFKVVKNTLLDIAARDTDMAVISDALKGPTAMVLHASDASIPARILAGFAKQHEAVKIKGGVISGKFYNAGQIESVGKLPGRETLMAMLAGALQSGPSRLLGVVSALPQKMAGALAALKEAREQAG